MKTKIFMLLAVAGAFLATSCEPQENRYELTNSFDYNDTLDLSFENPTGVSGSNYITVKMNTPGVYGYWNYGVGTKASDEATFTYPGTGEVTCTFYVYNSYIHEDGTVQYGYSQDIVIPVTTLDVDLDVQYEYLVGADLDSKTWEFACGGSGTYGVDLFYFMSPSGDAGSYMSCWWDAGNTGGCINPADADGSLTFDLNGGANMTYRQYDGGPETQGSFAFNADYSKFTTSGAYILGCQPNAQVDPLAEFTVCELSDESFALYASSTDGGTGWTWLFVPKVD